MSQKDRKKHEILDEFYKTVSSANVEDKFNKVLELLEKLISLKDTPCGITLIINTRTDKGDYHVAFEIEDGQIFTNVNGSKYVVNEKFHLYFLSDGLSFISNGVAVECEKGTRKPNQLASCATTAFNNFRLGCKVNMTLEIQ